MTDPQLRKRILRARAAYRDKSKGVPPLRAKCRVVALGHCDPDLHELSRESATPTRQCEYLVYAVFVCGLNMMFMDGSANGVSGEETSKPPFFKAPQRREANRCTSCHHKMA